MHYWVSVVGIISTKGSLNRITCSHRFRTKKWEFKGKNGRISILLGLAWIKLLCQMFSLFGFDFLSVRCWNADLFWKITQLKIESLAIISSMLIFLIWNQAYFTILFYLTQNDKNWFLHLFLTHKLNHIRNMMYSLPSPLLFMKINPNLLEKLSRTTHTHTDTS